MDKRIYKFCVLLFTFAYTCTSFVANAANAPGEGNVIEYYRTESDVAAVSSLTEKQTDNSAIATDIMVAKDKVVDFLKEDITNNLEFRIELSEEYNDNIFIDYYDRNDDWITKVKPGVKWTYTPSIKGLRKGMLGKLFSPTIGLDLKFEYWYYKKHPDQDQNSPDNSFKPDLSGEVEFSDRLSFDYAIKKSQTSRGAIKPSTSGKDTNKNVDYWDTMYGGTLKLGPKTNIWEIDYQHQKTTYDESDLETQDQGDTAKDTINITSYFGESENKQLFLEYEVFKVKYLTGANKRKNYIEHEFYGGWRGKILNKIYAMFKVGTAFDYFEGEKFMDEKGQLIGEAEIVYSPTKRFDCFFRYTQDVNLISAPTDTTEGFTIDITKAQREQKRYMVGASYIPSIFDKKVLLVATAAYNDQEYAATGSSELDSGIEEYLITFKPSYEIREDVTLVGTYEYKRRMSNDDVVGYIQNSFKLTVKWEF